MHEEKQASHTAVYNHTISGLMLGEVYGQVSGARAKQVKQAIERALKFSQELQSRPKRYVDIGGWRYVPVFRSGIDSDLSVTGWQLMFFRSAKNAEFDVPEKSVSAAVDYVRAKTLVDRTQKPCHGSGRRRRVGFVLRPQRHAQKELSERILLSHHRLTENGARVREILFRGNSG